MQSIRYDSKQVLEKKTFLFYDKDGKKELVLKVQAFICGELMRNENMENICFQDGTKEDEKNTSLWVQYDRKILYFTPVDGFEEIVFKSLSELMQFAKACVGAGYMIG